MTFYLASQSPRRRDLLATFGVPFQVLSPALDIDMEALEAPYPNEIPLNYVKRVTRAKLTQAINQIEINQTKDIVLCADTTVALGQRILGKPINAVNNAVLLAQLQGKTHRVLTAVALYAGGNSYETLCTSYVKFGVLSQSEIETYANGGEGWDKAGGYAIQGVAAAFVQRITGSYTGVVGLPLWETRELLASAKLL